MQPNIENFIGCDSSYRAASIVLYGAPYDSTTSYRPGARFGPAAIRHESYGLETYSPYQNADLTDFDIFDSGDLELCFGSSESALADIEARAEEILQDGKFPLLLGGEHLVTLGAVRAAVKKYPDLHIVHFDAHADLRDDYLGAKLSHACVLRRCHELVGDGRIHQFCIRSGDRAEFEFAAQHTEMHKFDFTGLAELTRLELPEEEKADMLEQMQKILDYMDLLNSVDTDATEPLIQFEDLRNVFREDEVKPSFDRDELMRNAKKKLDGAYQVPRTVE